MKKYAVMIGLAAMVAGAYASDITIYDGVSQDIEWHGGVGGGGPSPDLRPGVKEDQEVELGCDHGQQWDLEAFTLSNGRYLGMIGGFDFKNGAGTDADGKPFLGGDIFISNGSTAPLYGPAADAIDVAGGAGRYQDVSNSYGYNYAIDLIFDGSKTTYKVYELNSSSTLSCYFRSNDESNPFELVKNGETVVDSGIFFYNTGLSDAALDNKYLGGSHNQIAGIDLSFLSLPAHSAEFYAHYTMGCGNDNMMGHGTTSVPEPGSLMMLGSGLLSLLGMSFIRRKKK